MEFVIGSTNQAKVNAVKKVLTMHYTEAIFAEISVPSGVADQPFGDDETKTGAINRAIAAASTIDGSMGIGLEGGVKLIGRQMYLCNWGALVMTDGMIFTAGGAQIPLPDEIAKELNAGKELGPVVDQYFKTNGIRQKEGAIGMFTMQVVNRDDLFEHIMKLLVGQMKYFLGNH